VSLGGGCLDGRESDRTVGQGAERTWSASGWAGWITHGHRHFQFALWLRQCGSRNAVVGSVDALTTSSIGRVCGRTPKGDIRIGAIRDNDRILGMPRQNRDWSIASYIACFINHRPREPCCRLIRPWARGHYRSRAALAPESVPLLFRRTGSSRGGHADSPLNMAAIVRVFAFGSRQLSPTRFVSSSPTTRS